MQRAAAAVCRAVMGTPRLVGEAVSGVDLLLDDAAGAYGGLSRVALKKVELRWTKSRAVEYDLASARRSGAM